MANTEQMVEYMRCLEDIPYSLKTFNETFDKTRNKFVPFELFEEQENLLELYRNNRFVLVSKYRQAGITTVTAGYCANRIVFGDPENPDKFLIMANKQDTALEFLAKIKTFIDQYPSWVGMGRGENKDKGALHYGKESQKHITILNRDNKSVGEVKAVATSVDALRGYTPTLLIMDEAAFIEGGADLWGACLASLGCLTKDTLILTDNGLVSLDELVVEKNEIGFTTLETPYKVCNMNGDIVDATETFVSEYGDTYKIKTKLGLEIEGSWKHPIYLNGDKWVRMQDLNVGDEVVIQYNQNFFGDANFIFNYTTKTNEKDVPIPTNLNDNLNFAYLLGLYVAKGNFQKGGIAITNADPEIIDFLVNDGSNLGLNFKSSREYHYYYTSTKLIRWLEAFGLKKHNARCKEIPLPLLKMSKEVIKSFLQGMFDGDGMSTYKEIKYSSTSHKLIKTLQTLLLNFGIISHIRKEISKTSESSIITNKNHITTIYNLFIYSNHALKFYEEIGFRLTRKQKNVDQLIHELLVQIEKQKNYYIDEIVSIEKSQDYTYDLHVPETHSFISNGIISHNTGGKAIMISTPRGMDELYYKTYAESMKGINSFKIFQMYWYDDPRYNKGLFFVKYDGNLVDWMSNSEVRNEYEIKHNILDIPREEWDALLRDNWKPCSPWFEDMCRELNFDKRMIAQELECSFLSSGDNVVDSRVIAKQETENVCDPIEKQLEQKLWIWEQPKIGHKYIIGVDVSRGDSEDFSSFVIVDFDDMEEVVEYQTKLPPDIFAEIVFKWAHKYTAFIVVDITGGMGVATSRKLQELTYPNELMYFDGIKDTDKWKYGIYDDRTAGINYNSKRAQIIQAFEEGIRNGFKIRSKRLIQETKTFVYINGRADHMRGHHDDIIQSLAMALYVAQNSFTKFKQNEKQVKAMLNAWVSTTSKKPDVTNSKLLSAKSGMPNMWLFSGLQ